MKYLEIEKKNNILTLGVTLMCCLCFSHIFSMDASVQTKAEKTLVVKNKEQGK